jgi:hypothetical protein
LAFGDHDPEDAGPDWHALEALVEFGIGRSEPLYCDDVHVDVALVEEIDEPHLRCRERQAERQGQVVGFREIPEAGDLRRDPVQGLQLVAIPAVVRHSCPLQLSIVPP